MRQGSNDAKSSAFKTALAELHINSVSNLTWKHLLTKCQQGLSINEVVSFNNAIQLYNTHAAVGKYNAIWLCNFLQPVVVIKSVNTSVGAQKVTPN